MGDLRSYGFAAESHACPLPMQGAVICGIAGLSGFVAPALSRLYATSAGTALKHVTANASNTPPAGWAPHSLAAAIERDPVWIARAIGDVMPGDATHVLVPAVLGIQNVEHVRAAISERLGVPVFECLGAPPSIPGWRLDRALMRVLDTAGIELITATVVGVDAAENRITRVRAVRNGDTLLLAAARFVLTTGKFLGGGIATHDQDLIEPAIGLPVWIEHLDQSFATAESLTLTSRVRTYDQPLLRAGVHTNSAHQPIDARQRVLYENVVAAGATISGADANTLGLGDAATSAIEAVRSLNQGAH
jgi:glycerol-3-phosphate dehydrogenase subunit B